MAETIQGIPESEGKAASSRPWIIVVIIIVVLCCLLAVCAGAVWFLWENGDRLLNDFTDWSAIFSFI